MILRGRVWRFGDDVNTDLVIPAKYLNITDAQELGRHCMEGIAPNFYRKVTMGDIIVGGKNFGCGSSREHAAIAIKAAGIACVIAKTFSRIFYRNAFNIGFPILECAACWECLKEGEEVEVNLNTGQIQVPLKSQLYQAKPVPPFMLDLIRSGGLMNYHAKRLNNEGRRIITKKEETLPILPQDGLE